VQEIGGKKVPAKDVFHAGRSTVYLPNLRVALSDLQDLSIEPC
jgi:hypothetical protein